MGYLTAQVILFLVVAGVLGFLIGWFFRGRALKSKHAAAEQDWSSRLDAAERRKVELASSISEKDADLQRLRGELHDLEQDRIGFAEIRNERDALRVDLADTQSVSQRLMAAMALSEDDMRSLRNQLSASQSACQMCNAELERLRTQNSRGRRPAFGQSETMPYGEAAVVISAARSSTASRDGSDDLKKISGIGPKIEGLLHELGIFTYAQIAEFTPEKVSWIDERLRFKGRIEREGWIQQARTLFRGSSTDSGRNDGPDPPAHADEQRHNARHNSSTKHDSDKP